MPPTDTTASPAYDAIGVGYAARRRPDHRIQRLITEALGDAQRVLDVGAGAGSYEPVDREMIVAVDPSATMLAQRGGESPAVRGTAEKLPINGGAFDAVMAVLTVHHWHDRRAGYAELRRAARRQVVLTYEPAIHNRLWIIAEYVPAIAALEAHRPGFCVDEIADALSATTILTVPVPWDCTDGFIMAYWRRPEAYLDPRVRRATSGFSLVGNAAVDDGLRRLRADLASGSWQRRHADLPQREELDAGLRLVVGGG